jgi:hypothetical protein
MRLCDRSADGKAEAGARGLGRAERIEDPIDEIGGHAWAAVADFDAQRLVAIV